MSEIWMLVAYNAYTKMTKPKFWAKVNMLRLMERPNWPKKIPTKNTKVTPSETPHTLILPRPSPQAMIMLRIITACKEDSSKNRLDNQLILITKIRTFVYINVFFLKTYLHDEKNSPFFIELKK